MLLANEKDDSRDLVIPAVGEKPVASGKRVRVALEGYEKTEVYHLLYLPTDWVKGNSYPVIFEYPGNRTKKTPGTIESCKLGFGLSGGEGVIWVCLPFVDKGNAKHALNWWGDVAATVDYCKRAVVDVCANYGGDSERVYLAGFSRGAIACNFIGLHDAEIASLWRGFICHSHYDGVRKWGYAGSDTQSALMRLNRLGKRPQWISHEVSFDDTERYLRRNYPNGQFSFMALPSPEHSANWVLSESRERRLLREWFRSTLEGDD
ncbi:MAG: hypothetical protein AB8D78_01575 [Akkermansiaceae bacterium]